MLLNFSELWPLSALKENELSESNVTVKHVQNGNPLCHTDHALCSSVTSAGFVKRLIWPGLLLASLTANLLFTCLYMYHNWGWTVDGSAAVLLWPAQSEFLSCLWTWESFSNAGKHPLSAMLTSCLVKTRMSADRFSAAYLAFDWSYEKTV